MSQTIASALQEGATILAHAGVVDASRDARALLAHAISHDFSYLLAHGSDSLTKKEDDLFNTFIARRAGHEPLQYIKGYQEFFKLDFEVTPDVLIPRPETELIVETALELLRKVSAPVIADIGTGSGCIAISLLHELPQAQAVATDVSPAALRVAQRNAEKHGVADRLTLIESDCFSAVDSHARFSLIASNPPYVADQELDTVAPEVRNYEPRAALTCGGDGLNVIRRLLAEAPHFLESGSYFVFEIGFEQSEPVKGLIRHRVWQLLEIRADLQGIPRTVVLRRTTGSV